MCFISSLQGPTPSPRQHGFHNLQGSLLTFNVITFIQRWVKWLKFFFFFFHFYLTRAKACFFFFSKMNYILKSTYWIIRNLWESKFNNYSSWLGTIILYCPSVEQPFYSSSMWKNTRIDWFNWFRCTPELCLWVFLTFLYLDWRKRIHHWDWRCCWPFKLSTLKQAAV